MIKPVFLTTDVLFFLLFVVVVVFIIYARTKPHIREPWRRVFTGRIASASAVILLAFVVTGLLDSMHFRRSLENNGTSNEVHYSGDVLSVLDVLVGPMRTRVEKTYSAPFATQLYSKETVTQADGSDVRAYPPLKFGGRHLQDTDKGRGADILARCLLALFESLLVSVLVFMLLASLLARRDGCGLRRKITDILAQKTVLPWLVIVLAISVIVLLIFLSINLAAAYHVFGTDKVGQDVYYLSLKSIRTGLLIGSLTTLVMLPFAIMLGILAGYMRGWIDDVVQYIYTTLNSIPGVLLIAASILMLQVFMANHPEYFETTEERADIRLLFLCIILGITSWTGLCRLLRGESLKLREAEYIQAAVSFGVSHGKVITRHILPNVMHIVLITVGISVAWCWPRRCCPMSALVSTRP